MWKKKQTEAEIDISQYNIITIIIIIINNKWLIKRDLTLCKKTKDFYEYKTMEFGN